MQTSSWQGQHTDTEFGVGSTSDVIELGFYDRKMELCLTAKESGTVCVSADMSWQEGVALCVCVSLLA